MNPQQNLSPGLSEVLDVKDKSGKVVGHYQWAVHKDGKADSLVVVKVVKDHDGNEQVLYKTYSESVVAKKVMEESAGSIGIKENLATVKIGEQYKNHKGETSNYGIENMLEFQGVGFVLVICILAGLWGLVSLISYIVKLLKLTEPAKPAAPKPVAASAQKTIHPGMSDEHFSAIVSAASRHVSNASMSDEQLVAILTAVAAHTLGQPVSVVKFKPLNTMDWTWAVQGRVALHSRKV